MLINAAVLKESQAQTEKLLWPIAGKSLLRMY